KVESKDPAKTEKEVEELNQLNKSLFWQELASNPKARTGQLQVLTNKPRSVYYIATITSAVEPTSYSYYGDVLPRALGRAGSQNKFVAQVQEEYGKEFLRLLSQQLRQQGEVTVSDNAKKQFDAESSTPVQ